MRVLVKRNEVPKVARIVCYWCGSDLEVYSNDFREYNPPRGDLPSTSESPRKRFKVTCGACDAPIDFDKLISFDKTPAPMTNEELAILKMKVKKR